jgi:uncharacterized protein YbjQ (UPF0145 family)
MSASPAGPIPSSTPPSQVLVSTMNNLAGYEVVETYGEVFGLVVRSRNLFSNIGAGFRTVFGGEARGYTQLLAETRSEAVERLRAEAAGLGANAVLMMRFDTGVFASVMNEVAAYGTAVLVRPVAAEPAPGI